MALSLKSLRIVFLPAALWMLSPDLPGADCNGNGIEDAAELAPGKPALSVEKGIETGAPSLDLVAADLTGSGAADLLAVFPDASLSVFENEGDLSFRELRTILSQAVRF